MIEIHAHVLPGLDDGPADLDEAFPLIAAYARHGVHDIICTSHFTSKQMQKCDGRDYLARYEAAFMLCNAAFKNSEHTICLHPGLELELIPDLLNCLKSYPKSLSLAGSDYLLVELPRWLGGELGVLENLLYSIQLAGFVPILAHPERTVDFSKFEVLLARWVEQEHVFLQVNAGSLVDMSDSTAEQVQESKRRRGIVDRIIHAGMVHVVASDAHHIIRRPPLHQQAWQILTERYGKTAAQILLQDNPSAILANKPIKTYNLDMGRNPS